MAHAILKLSYNKIGENIITGGICGTAFFINEKMALTANHVLGESNYRPNEGFSFCQYWLVSRKGRSIPLSVKQIKSYPSIDTSTIAFESPQISEKSYKVSNELPISGEEVISYGYISGGMPDVKSKWQIDHLAIERAKLSGHIADKDGSIVAIKILDINANDIKLGKVQGIEVSFPGMVGMSGGPLISKRTNKVIGILSIGLPPDVPIKKTIFAISMYEVIRNINWR